MNSRARSYCGIVLLLLGAASALACGRPPEEAEDHDEETGTPTVHLDSLGVEMAGIQLGVAEAIESMTLPVTGTITYDESRVSHVGPRTEGRIADIRAELGSRVRRGQTLAILESATVGRTQADLQEAQALLEIARENYEREKRLEEQGISSRKELLDAQATLRSAEAAAQGSRSELIALGGSGGSGGRFSVTAPFDGIVVEKHATLGEVAGPADQLFTVADISRLWIELAVFERDLPRVRTGQEVSVTTSAYPDRVFRGSIVYVGDILDPETRAVHARIEIANADRELKPGMFAGASIETGERGEPLVVVPRDAVQTVEGAPSIWIPGGSREFRAQPVTPGETLEDGRVRILSGLAPGDSLVVAGAFALKAELSKEEFGGHGH
jgi:cobalt-zinc-cadmium efflux system membrane fusion protein